MKLKLKVMNAQYQVLEQIIGKGSFGIVKLGLNGNNGKLVAIKTEAKTKKRGLLSHENSIIRSCTNGARRRDMLYPALSKTPKGVISSRFFWEDASCYYLVMDLMGPNIDALHKLCSRSFSLKTTLMLADQMLELITHYHRHDVIHRDIKPSNFLINYSIPHQHVNLIDFGLAKKYKIKGKKIPFSSGAAQVGSLRYMSKYVHSSIEPSCRDDLYSLGYCIVYMFTGMLPWQGGRITKMDKAERKRYVGTLKRETSNAELLQNCKCLDCTKNKRECAFQRSMMKYFDYLDSLEYDTTINYKTLSDAVKECFNSHGFTRDFSWDWSKYYIISSTSTGI
jgi:serine/threonine protein kinase